MITRKAALLVWDFLEFFYGTFGVRLQAPIEFFYPDFGPWLFERMMGIKGERMDEATKNQENKT